ncbi:MAG TPA: RluA family pseudouridine synthase [Actinomycetota bacterium]|jgi:23S rRNA pseudouridine1911/1915/1917 synthase
MTAEVVAPGPGRLDAVLAQALGVPRADVQRAIEAGRVAVDGRPRPKSFRLDGGERIDVELAGAIDVPAEGDPVPVRYRDEHLMVVAKPAGIPVHPTAARRTGTLVNRLKAMGVPLSSGSEPDRPGIVHRLDAGTSGLLVVASDDPTHALLMEMFRRHEVDRRYLALVRGDVEHDRFAVDAPLVRRGAVIRVRSEGREAETRFDVVERLPRSTLLEAAPRTGRTHQIRVHLSAVGHPILGDRRYGGGSNTLGLDRPFLHSWRIGFDHPVTGERIELEEALPDDLHRALRRARASA